MNLYKHKRLGSDVAFGYKESAGVIHMESADGYPVCGFDTTGMLRMTNSREVVTCIECHDLIYPWTND